MNSINTSKRDEINEFLIKRSIKNSSGNKTLNITNNYVHIVKDIHNSGKIDYNFWYACELELYDINETIYVYTNKINTYLDVFANTISLDNPIDQNLNINFSIRDLKVEFDNNKIKFYKNVKPHRYSNNKQKKVLAQLQYYNSLDKFDNRDNSIERIIDFNDFISKELTDTIEKDKFCKYANKLQENILQDKIISALISYDDISARITRTTIKNNGNITLHIEADDIIHQKDLTYTFKNPMKEKSKFLKFIDYMDVKSLDELEYQPVLLSKESNSINVKVNGWYINKSLNNNSSPF